jgi:hypothetical protein
VPVSRQVCSSFSVFDLHSFQHVKDRITFFIFSYYI